MLVRSDVVIRAAFQVVVLFTGSDPCSGGKAAFLSMLTGLLLSDDNLQAFNGIEKARDVTLERLSGQREALRKG